MARAFLELEQALRPRTSWDPAHDACLGSATDAAIAWRFSVTVATVRERRASLGIPKVSDRRPKTAVDATPPRRGRGRPSSWNPDHDRLLGTDSDAVIAAKTGVGVDVVRNRRNALGLRPGGRIGRPRKPCPDGWSTTGDIFLGADSDMAVARRLGVGHAIVRRRRRALGIPPGRRHVEDVTAIATAVDGQSGRRRQDPAAAERHAAILAMVADGRRDAAIAVALGVSRTLVGNIRARAGLPSFGTACRARLLASGLLGNTPDAVLATMFGMTPYIVGAARRAAGIVAKTGRRELAPDVVARLGREPDVAIARDAGLRTHAVRLARVARGLPPTRPRTTPRAWTAADDRLLGKDSDQAVADRLGITACMATMRRRRLGIAAHDRGSRWNPTDDALLGTAGDGAVAARLGRTTAAVQGRRAMLGIPACIPHVRWSQAEDALLGTMPDADVAARVGRTVAAVMWRRRGLGIPTMIAVAAGRWNPANDPLLGADTDAAVAKTVGMHWTTVRMRRRKLGIPAAHGRWDPAHDRLLGTDADTVVARTVGMCTDTVRARRRALGIPACVPHVPWSRADDALLGTMPDTAVAARLGRTAGAVKLRRRGLGIPTMIAVVAGRWNPANDPLLGTDTDVVVARTVGVHATTVGLRRRKLGIPAHAPPLPDTPRRHGTRSVRTGRAGKRR